MSYQPYSDSIRNSSVFSLCQNFTKLDNTKKVLVSVEVYVFIVQTDIVHNDSDGRMKHKLHHVNQTIETAHDREMTSFVEVFLARVFQSH